MLYSHWLIVLHIIMYSVRKQKCILTPDTGKFRLDRILKTQVLIFLSVSKNAPNQTHFIKIPLYIAEIII